MNSINLCHKKNLAISFASLFLSRRSGNDSLFSAVRSFFELSLILAVFFHELREKLKSRFIHSFLRTLQVVFFGLNFFWVSLLRRPQTKQSLSASLRCVQKLQVEARCLSLAAKVEMLSPLRWMQFWNQDHSVITSFFIVEWPLRMVARSLFTLLDKYLLLYSNIPSRCKRQLQRCLVVKYIGLT